MSESPGISKADLAYANFNYFCEYAFNEKYPNTWFHRKWCEAIQNQKVTRAINLSPRNSGKTTIWAKKAPLWLLGRNPNLKILMVSRTLGRASTNMRFIKGNIEGNPRIREVFPNLKPAQPWSDDEIVVENTRLDSEASVLARGLEGSITGFRADILIVDDLIDKTNVMTETQRSKVHEFWDEQVVPTLNPEARVFLVGCLVAGTRVSLKDGSWKPIEEFVGGEEVLSFASIQKVEAMIPQGEAEVYELKTRNSTIEATANHPFLVALDGEVHADARTSFVMLKDLKKGDKIVCKKAQSGWIQTINYSLEDLWTLGFMLGDGWITHGDNGKGSTQWITCFAKKKKQETNEKLVKYFLDRFNYEPKLTNYGYYAIRKHSVGKFFEEMGFKGKAKTKRIPKIIFSYPNEYREAFLNGILSADGHEDKTGRISIELSNYGLICDLKHLISGLGYKVSNIYTRSRTIKAPHSPKPILSTTHHIGFYRRKSEGGWGVETVISITPKGRKTVYDLTVSDTHNFIANNLVVHNTRYHSKDFYSRMLEEEEYKDNVFKITAFETDEEGREVKGPDGKPVSYWPDRWSTDRLLALKREISYNQGSIAWESQFMNNPTGFEGRLFKTDWLNFYMMEDIEARLGRLDYVMAVDPNITVTPRSDNTAIITAAVDKGTNEVYILDIVAQQLEFVDQLKILNEYARRNQLRVGKTLIPGEQYIRVIGVEAVAYQKALQQSGYLMGLPVVEVQHTKTDKLTRILRLSPHFENGRIKFPDPETLRVDWWDGFLDEYITYPRGRRDDRLDCLEVLLEVAGVTEIGSSIAFGPGSEMFIRDLMNYSTGRTGLDSSSGKTALKQQSHLRSKT